MARAPQTSALGLAPTLDRVRPRGVDKDEFLSNQCVRTEKRTGSSVDGGLDGFEGCLDLWEIPAFYVFPFALRPTCIFTFSHYELRNLDLHFFPQVSGFPGTFSRLHFDLTLCFHFHQI